MKYSEFREYSKRNNIPLREDEERLIVDNQFEISKIEKHSIIFSLGFIDFPYEFEMLKKAIELAETPLGERGEVILSDRREEQRYKMKFTKADIEELKKLKEKFDTDLRDIVSIEVED